MITMAQRIAELRTKVNMSQIELSRKLDWPRQAVEKFELGKQTPSKEQQQQLANFFSVSLAYVRAETNDPTRQDSFMDMILDAHEEPEPAYMVPAPKPKSNARIAQEIDEQSNSVFSAMAQTKEMQALVQKIVRTEINSPAFEEKIKAIIRQELKNRR